MKKILIILPAFFIFTSCRNDENGNQQIEASLIGKWSFQKVDAVKSATNQTQTIEKSDCDKKSIHEFLGTVHKSTFYGIVGSSCQLTGEVSSRNYTFDKANMKFWYENEQDYPYFITKLTENELVFEDRSQDVDNDGKTDIIRRYFSKIH